jgi:hypothetical protein
MGKLKDSKMSKQRCPTLVSSFTKKNQTTGGQLHFKVNDCGRTLESRREKLEPSKVQRHGKAM